MIPYIITPFGNLPTFSVMIVVGFISMIASVHISIKNSLDLYAEESYIYPKVITAAIIGYCSAAIFDSIFKIKINGGFVVSGITFYGGLIGAVLSMYLLLNHSKNHSQYSPKEWFNILTIPFIIFHILGRIGCFFAGCCYGKYTTCILGIHFPDNVESNIYHFGKACYPTQFFEAFALLIILLFLFRKKNKFKIYLICYSFARFIIEFFRGDNRGNICDVLSPAQFISMFNIFIISTYNIINATKTKKPKRPNN